MATTTNCINNFLSHCTYEKNLSDKSVKAYRIDLNQFHDYIKRSCLDIGVNLMDKEIIREYVKIVSEGNKPKTVKRKIATLKSFFNYLEFEETIDNNPFRKIKINIREGKRLPKTISLIKIIDLFRYMYDIKEHSDPNEALIFKAITRDIAVLELLFTTGLRVSELCSITTEQIDFFRASLRIIGKGNKERVIPICNAETLSALVGYYELFRHDILRTGYFFLNRLNRRLSEQSVRFMIKKYSKAARFDDNITPHMFRHSIATLLLERGVDIRYIQIFLGHSSITTTQIYVQVNEEAQRSILLEKHPRKSFHLEVDTG